MHILFSDWQEKRNAGEREWRPENAKDDDAAMRVSEMREARPPIALRLSQLPGKDAPCNLTKG
jgi:hypothetical protein